MKFNRLIIFVFTLFHGFSFGQNIPFDKQYIVDKEKLKEARRAIEEGDRIFNVGEDFGYSLAIAPYEVAYAINPNNDILNLKLGISYLHSPQKEKALGYLQKSYELNPDLDPENIFYLLGRGNHLNMKWEEAIKYYELQKSKILYQDQFEMATETLDRLINQCRNGKAMEGSPERVWIDNLGDNINSEFPEYSPLISTDESIIILTARRPDSTGELKDDSDNLPFEDIYFSMNIEGVWSPLKNMGPGVNTKGHDATSGLSPDGKTLFIFQGTRRGGGDIYVANLVNGVWSNPKKLNNNINTGYHESAAALSYDGKSLYFISDKPGGQGGRDIYISNWDNNKQDWGVARNLGPVVNSDQDEDGIFIHPDGKTIYFSSKGHNSIGGSDIFSSSLENNTWQPPVNIGFPINSPDDDVFFVVAADGRTAYYSSIREGGKGEKDIYRITFLGPEKQPVLNSEDALLASVGQTTIDFVPEPKVEIKTSRMTLLKGRILDEQTKLPVAASIDLVDNISSGILASFENDPSSGSYLVSLPAGRNYGVAVSADGYLFHSEHFDIPDTAVFKQYNRDIYLKKMEIGKVVVLKNIFFDYNQYSIRSESTAELERLTTLLRENPEMRIEISGHTDNVGSDTYNQELSQNRAKSVVDFLINKGIPTSRLEFKGYGKNMPVATNETPEGRQENRRTEFKILGN